MKQKIIFALFFLLANTCSALACPCLGSNFIKDPVGKALRQSSAVFTGRVISAEYKKGISNAITESQETQNGEKVDLEVLVYTFEVERFWKGDVNEKVELVAERTKDDSGIEIRLNCDFIFEVGKQYLVYAYRYKENLSTGACLRTTLLWKAKQDLEVLGEGQEPKSTSKIHLQSMQDLSLLLQPPFYGEVRRPRDCLINDPFCDKF